MVQHAPGAPGDDSLTQDFRLVTFSNSTSLKPATMALQRVPVGGTHAADGPATVG